MTEFSQWGRTFVNTLTHQAADSGKKTKTGQRLSSVSGDDIFLPEILHTQRSSMTQFLE